MLIADIKERLSKHPFKPFRIRSSSGEIYKISSPFLIALMKSKLFIAVPNSDRWAELSYLHIAALESAENGHTSRDSCGKRRR